VDLIDPDRLGAHRAQHASELRRLARSLGLHELAHEEELFNHLLFRPEAQLDGSSLEQLDELGRFGNAYFWFRVVRLLRERATGHDAALAQHESELLAAAPPGGRELVAELDAQALRGVMLAVERDPRIDRLIADIDRRVAGQLEAIFARPELRALERIWTSLEMLVSQVQRGDNVVIEILNCNKGELTYDIERHALEQTMLYQRLYAGVYEARERVDPYGAVIGDYEFGPWLHDVVALSVIGRVAWVAHCPFIAAASPAMLEDGAERFTQASYAAANGRDQQPSMVHFRTLRESEEARFLALTMPRVALREPHEAEEEPLWGLACWPLAARLVNSFVRYGWCANIVGNDAEWGGLVEGLRPETDMTEKQEYELSELGLVPLRRLAGTDLACFDSARTLAAAKYFGTSEEGRDAEMNHWLGHCRLPYLFVLCRITQYMLVVHREQLGILRERVDQERELNRWLCQYTADRSVVSSAMRGRRMLRKVQVIVEEGGDEAAWNRFVLRMRPHFKFMGAFFTLSVAGRLPRRSE
jgi:type VI secretion system protein ImpC